MGVLDGKAAIVTGAGRGIGAATAEALVEAGASVLLLARRPADITGLAGRLRANGGRVEAMTCDVARWSQVEAAAAFARESFGRIDILVNNAAVIEPIAPLAGADAAAWGASIDIGVKGVFHGMRAVLPEMRARGAGVIVNLGSGAALNPLEGWSAYCAGKAAVHMLTRCVHLENRGRGVRAMTLSPGTVATDMQRAIRASGINPVSQMDFASHAPATAPARAIVWLCTEAAADLAGEVVSLRDPEVRRRIGLD
ncbi:SDR family oxidoreductase [Amaricoccus sp.]|uniref:SDR family oxidoreductase n=1 Tax=Amaricoccus sp. TaxID=1872485 RepID=UPI001B3DEC77|nr:SDR family oxidoreductase [Amaricoccus sp.]MBP7002480.1 SDR family oxidoreductase [Amaricoccus sp.]